MKNPHALSFFFRSRCPVHRAEQTGSRVLGLHLGHNQAGKAARKAQILKGDFLVFAFCKLLDVNFFEFGAIFLKLYTISLSLRLLPHNNRDIMTRVFF